MSNAQGWFADVRQEPEDGPEDKWQPCLETGTGHVPCFNIWFDSKEDCEQYIREQIIPIAGVLLD